ncbi:MAG TPA: fused MFS/spermidine synthase [Planctomycetota bacterium]|nr:fused MFS/spermidine synthase [Planctomycetota bacterium]
MRPILPPAAAVFLAGAGTMAFEILVPRRLAPWLGTALPVWTSTFAVVLAGLALGAAVGGWVADRVRRGVGEPVVFLLAAVGILAAPELGKAAAAYGVHLGAVEGAVVTTTVAAFLPLFLLGMVYPFAARDAVVRSREPGPALGRLSAAGALGSVAGTFATSYGLLPRVGVTLAHGIVAGMLVLAGLLRAGGPRPEASEALPLPPPRPAGSHPLVAATPLSVAALLAIAGLGGLATLVLEVVAARRTALDAGSSLEAWTSVLAVVLGGLALGGTIGGLLAPIRNPRRTLVATLVVAALLCGATPWTARAVAWALGLPEHGFRLRVAIGVAVAYGAAFTAIGALPPVLARAALAGHASAGRRVGAISAVGTLGALVGSLATGPRLLPWLRLEGTVFGLAGLLALSATLVARRRLMPALATCGALALAVVAAAPWARARERGLELGLRPDADGVWVTDGGYARVLVDVAPEASRYDRAVRRMKIDLRTHGIHDLKDPSWIGSNYGTLYAAATERLASQNPAPRVLFLGGGTYTAPRWIRTWRPDASVHVAEIDPEVTRGAREALALTDLHGLRIDHADARTVVRDAARSSDVRYDLVYMDAFGDLGVPWHLTTLDFVRDVKSAMPPGGVYFANSIDVFDSGRFVGAMYATLRAAFAHVEVIGVSRWDAWVQNFVFVASDTPLDLDDLERRDPSSRDGRGTLDVYRYPRADFEALVERVHAVPLTDDFAPVEDLLAPAVELTSRR